MIEHVKSVKVLEVIVNVTTEDHSFRIKDGESRMNKNVLNNKNKNLRAGKRSSGERKLTKKEMKNKAKNEGESARPQRLHRMS